MILVIFVGDSIFYQRVLFCVGTFVYGIPIPLAYLLNESRVRDTIVNHGWLQGFWSVFYSSTHIRENKREAIQNTKRKESMAKDDGHDGFNGVLNNQLRSPNQEEANLVQIIPKNKWIKFITDGHKLYLHENVATQVKNFYFSTSEPNLNANLKLTSKCTLWYS